MALFVGHLNEKIKDPALRELFEPYGTVTNIDRKGTYAFIEYAPGADTDHAVRDLNKKEILGTVIRVELSNRARGQAGPPPGDLSETCYNCQQVGHIAKNCHLQAQPPNLPHWQRIKQQQQQQQPPPQRPKSPQCLYKQVSSRSLFEHDWAPGPPPNPSHQQSRLAKRGGMLDRNPGRIHLSAPRNHPYWPNTLHPAGGDGAGPSSSRGKAKHAHTAQPQLPFRLPGASAESPASQMPYQGYPVSLINESVYQQRPWPPHTTAAHQPRSDMSTMPGLISGRPMHHQYHGPGPEPISMPPPLSPASAERAVYPDPRAIAAIPLEGLPYMVSGTVMYVPVLAMPPPNHQSAHPSHTMPLAQPILLPQSHILSPGSPPQPLVAIYPHMGSALHSLAGPYPGPAAPTRESTVSLPDPPKNMPAYPAAPQPHGPHPPIWPEPHESRRQAAHDRQPELAAAAGYYTSSAPPGIEKRAGIGSLDAMPPVRIEPLPSTGDADCTDGTSAAERTGSGKSE